MASRSGSDVPSCDADLERRLARVLTVQAETAATPYRAAERARRGVRRRRLAVVTATAVAALLAVGGLVQVTRPSGGAGDGSAPLADTRPSISPSHSAEPDARTGALWPPGAAQSCVEEYSPRTLQHRAFAFDGVVIDIEDGQTSQADSGPLDLAAVTFEVKEWFKGGSGAEVAVDMGRPDEGREVAAEFGPTYELGTRLLVTGEPRWGGGALDDPIAWGCGFTHYYDANTAAIWRDAFAKQDPTPGP